MWTAAGGAHYTGKPRPVVIIQDDRFDRTASVTVCPLTSDPLDIPLLRVPIQPDEINRLTAPSMIMIDKVTTVPRIRLGECIGRVSDADMVGLSRRLFVFLGLA